MGANGDFGASVPVINGAEAAMMAQQAQQQYPGAMVEVEQSRAVQEVQAAMVIAKRFPRDEIAATNSILVACERKSLAERAVYAYPRGGQMVTGPSIRLAETIARYWGNLEYGMRELSQANGSSTMEAYCWDKQTNVRAVRTFEVAHKRYTRQGVKHLQDPRDIYELVANQGARRMRACILEVVPGHIVDESVERCGLTMSGGGKEPIEDRARKMVAAFREQGVTKEMIEGRIGHNLDAIIEPELANLRMIFTSLRDGMSKIDDWFDRSAKPAKEPDPEPAKEKEPPATPPEPAQDEPKQKAKVPEGSPAKELLLDKLREGFEAVGAAETAHTDIDSLMAMVAEQSDAMLKKIEKGLNSEPVDLSTVVSIVNKAKK